MLTLSRIKKSLALFILAAMSALAMPTAASGQGDEPSGSITVGVEITEDEELCDGVASISIIQPDESGERLELAYVETVDPDLNLYSVIMSAIAFSITDYLYIPADEDISESFQGTLASEIEPINLFSMNSLVYANESTTQEEGFQPHPADLNFDGVIDLDDDVPPLLRERYYRYVSEDFELEYNVGVCDSEIMGGVDVVRSSLSEEISGTDAELWDFYGEVPEGARGVAFLVRENQSDPEGFLPNFHAQWPTIYDGTDRPQFTDYVSFGESGSETFRAEMSLVGDYLVGNFQTQFQFNLQIDTYQFFHFSNTPLCKFLNPNWEQDNLCAAP